MLSITVRKRWPGYEAMLTDDKRVWEGGLSEVEALGKLMISLDAAERGKQGMHSLLAWLPWRERIRIERE